MSSPFRCSETESAKVTSGQASGGFGGDLRVEEVDELIRRHPLQRVVVRDDHGAGLAERLVAAGVIVVPVRVEYEADRRARYGGDGLRDLRHQRRELVVDEQHAVRPDEHRDVARDDAGGAQHVETVGELLALDLGLVVIRRLLRSGAWRCRASRARSSTVRPIEPLPFFFGPDGITGQRLRWECPATARRADRPGQLDRTIPKSRQPRDLAADRFPHAAHLAVAAFAQDDAERGIARAGVLRRRARRTSPDRRTASRRRAADRARPVAGCRARSRDTRARSRSTGCISRWASSPSVVKSSSPEVPMSRRPIEIQRPASAGGRLCEHGGAALGVAPGRHLPDGLVI